MKFSNIPTDKKLFIGMIHLDDISFDNGDNLKLEKIYDDAVRDLKSLEKGGADAALVENFFDLPYSTTLDIEQIIRFAFIFTKLKQISEIPLGVNLQQTDGNEEVKIAHICGGDFIRSEAFVETRIGSFGTLEPQAKKIMKYKKERKSNVSVLADINVKHSSGIVNQPIDEIMEEANNAGADALILTGTKTGRNPDVKEVKRFNELAEDTPILVGSGINEQNIKNILKYSNGVIVGSSIKKNGDISNAVDVKRVKKLTQLI